MYDVPPPAAPGFYSPSAPRFKDATSFPDRSVGKLAVAPERHPDADERKLTQRLYGGLASPRQPNRHRSRFVATAPRFPDPKPTTPAHIGPGAYDITGARAQEAEEMQRFAEALEARDGARVWRVLSTGQTPVRSASRMVVRLCACVRWLARGSPCEQPTDETVPRREHRRRPRPAPSTKWRFPYGALQEDPPPFPAPGAVDRQLPHEDWAANNKGHTIPRSKRFDSPNADAEVASLVQARLLCCHFSTRNEHVSQTHKKPRKHKPRRGKLSKATLRLREREERERALKRAALASRRNKHAAHQVRAIHLMRVHQLWLCDVVGVVRVCVHRLTLVAPASLHREPPHRQHL